LDGVDGDWVSCGTRRFASYTQLAPGDYIFRVKGSNSDGVWNTEGASVAIHIEPPFWRTWWFAFAVLGTIVLAGIGAYRSRVNKLLELERLRTRIGSDLHDDIGSGLTHIAVLSDIALQQTDALQKTAGNTVAVKESDFGAVETIRRLGDIARELVDAMSDVVWSIDPRHESLSDLVQRIRSHAVQVCEARNIRFRLDVTGDIDRLRVNPDALRAMLLIAKEAVTNVVRHSGCREARMMISCDRKTIRISIEDDGRGFDTSREAAGNGLRNMRSRAEKLGGRLQVVSGPGKGTRIDGVLGAT
jgi:signal transduction histidine kinase